MYKWATLKTHDTSCQFLRLCAFSITIIVHSSSNKFSGCANSYDEPSNLKAKEIKGGNQNEQSDV